MNLTVRLGQVGGRGDSSSTELLTASLKDPGSNPTGSLFFLFPAHLEAKMNSDRNFKLRFPYTQKTCSTEIITVLELVRF